MTKIKTITVYRRVTAGERSPADNAAIAVTSPYMTEKQYKEGLKWRTVMIIRIIS